MKQNVVNVITYIASFILITLLFQAKNDEAGEIKKVCVSKNYGISSYKVDNVITDVCTKTVNEEELSLLAHLLMGECGASYTDDEMLYLTGAVVLNRVQSEYFPNSIKEVIYQKGQYQCIVLKNSGFYKEPTERCWRIASELLINGYDTPPNVLFQAEFVQGNGIYAKIQNMYFCYA